VLHPYISAILRLRAARTEGRRRRADRLPVAAFIVPIVCEPLSEKLAPASDSHGRISLSTPVAKPSCADRLGGAYGDDNLRDPEILGLARRVRTTWMRRSRAGALQRRGRSLKAAAWTEVEEYTAARRKTP
jgi:hypothetical protein